MTESPGSAPNDNLETPLGGTPRSAPDSPGMVNPVCSARGCRRPAVWGLLWNNPTLHSPERRKVWTACEDHRTDLESFLRSRGFLRETVPSSELE